MKKLEYPNNYRFIDRGFLPSDHRTVRDKLCDLLPEILPKEPGKILGAEIMRLVKDMPGGLFAAEATIRYHLSILSLNPSTPIAKCQDTQGYYLRPENQRTPENYFSELGRQSDVIDAAFSLIANLMGLHDLSVVETYNERSALMTQLFENEPDKWVALVEKESDPDPGVCEEPELDLKASEPMTTCPECEQQIPVKDTKCGLCDYEFPF